ncbi:MAG: preprotein translocase subunit SecA [Methylococcales symbiont of Iophon sp. n. MRB-2018]|nr:MAG: preprotein translocase subunit SecA [Methylococcales symbiont of Iophon sp. n. MRB-2018]KAF3980279.1 MAG: preprotein translocase subunit SecA [Methylococcales symbiont of Iophon sp. n. MRB-2018]
MLNKLTKLFVGSRNDRNVKKKRALVKKVNAFAAAYEKLSDEQLKAKTQEFRDRLAQGTKLNALIPEAFSVAREASVRVFKMRHFDVQLIGGMILNDGKIAEMKTGEGKTLMATLAAYLNSLPAKGVHIVTVNDYLAARDAEWMGQLYSFLGLTTGVITSEMEFKGRKEAYAADITYGTNNEFGFDYLRDNMAFNLQQKVQRELKFAIVDEVDSILIDEARTPLIISGPTEEGTEIYLKTNKLVPFLTAQEIVENKEEQEMMPGDYLVDEKSKQIHLTETGHERIECLMVEHGMMEAGATLYDAANIRLMHYFQACLRAHILFQKDVDYVVRNDEVIIVDEFTGRMMTGRRWSDGLHQAVEAKEGVTVQSENQTLASITFQNYFRLYEKLSGMTGTADTESFELNKIYGLEVVVIPTHKDMIRDDKGDLVYLSQKEKYLAIVEGIKECAKNQQPVLVGTTSIENSEIIAQYLSKSGIKHEVLNAKQHEREAHIIENAGMPGAVTIATNMAGRGTDIVLGGNLDAEIKALAERATVAEKDKVIAQWQERHEQVIQSGGLHVIGSERHESRRIDNQLRGRSGRQGDPGSTRFYLSLEDDLMRIFASERVARLMKSLGMEDGEAIEHKWVTRAIENAQTKVEGRNFDMRKEILAYDDVANDQRKVIYEHRNELMAAEDITDMISELRYDVLNDVISKYIPVKTMEEQWDIQGLEDHLSAEYLLDLPLQDMLNKDRSFQESDLRKTVVEALEQSTKEREILSTDEVMRHFEKSIMLQVLDNSWKEHLAAMDALRQGIHFRGYAQKDPKQEYKRESFDMFSNLLDHIKYEVIGILAKVQVAQEKDVAAIDEKMQAPQEMHYDHAEANPALQQPEKPAPAPAKMTDKAEATAQPFVRGRKKIGRNDPCPCGSKKKYKQCHGKLG